MAKYIRPTIDTKFHIDFSWWQKPGQNLRSHLQSYTCPECQAEYQDQKDRLFDWVDLQTGEVFQIDLLWYLIHIHCSQQPDFIDDRTPLTTAIFRLFIANDNTPLTPAEIHEQLKKKNPETILRTIGRRQVYKGIRPVVTSV